MFLLFKLTPQEKFPVKKRESKGTIKRLLMNSSASFSRQMLAGTGKRRLRQQKLSRKVIQELQVLQLGKAKAGMWWGLSSVLVRAIGLVKD